MGRFLAVAMSTVSIPKILYIYYTDYLSICIRFPTNFDCSFEWGLTPNLGEGEAVGDRDDTVRKCVGEFLI